MLMYILVAQACKAHIANRECGIAVVERVALAQLCRGNAVLVMWACRLTV